MPESLRVQRDGPIAVITLDRPARRNALDQDMLDGLRRAAMTLADTRPRVVIVAGEGEHFCAGLDLSPDNAVLARIQPLIAAKDAYRLGEVIRGLRVGFDALARIPAPVIAAIEGACLGGGLELALSADLRVASDTAFFSMPETRFGMVPDLGGTVRLQKRVGHARASQLILTGERIDADTADRWGLVNRIVPAGTALEAAREMASSILAASPAATLQALMALRGADELSDDARFELETQAGARALVSGEVAEGLAAFAGKREPRW